MVSYFKYLGRIISSYDDNWPVVVANLQKELNNWAWISHILGREGADANTLGIFYKTVVQSWLLFGSEIWVMTPCIGSTLGVFHHLVSLRRMVKQPRRGADRRLRYPPMTEAVVEAPLE